MTEPHGDVPSVPDIGVKSRQRGDVLCLLWFGGICVAAVLYLMWLDGAIGSAP